MLLEPPMPAHSNIPQNPDLPLKNIRNFVNKGVWNRYNYSQNADFKNSCIKKETFLDIYNTTIDF